MPRQRRQTVTSVGCGIIGQAWTILFTCAGHTTNLYHPRKERLEEAIKGIRQIMIFLDRKGVLRCSVKESISRIDPVTDLREGLSNVEFVQESLPERLEIKKKIFEEIDQCSEKGAILSSSTSGLSMTEIQCSTARPERCIIVHPFNPPYLVPLVEIVPGSLTSEKTVRKTFDFFSSLGREPIIVRREVEGFVGNRLAAALWREAIDLVAKGVVSAEEVDRAVHSGLGLRWAIMGQHLIYTINGGRGGVAAFIERYGPGYSKIWKSMDQWTEIGSEREEKLIKSIEKMPAVKSKSYDALVKERDANLISILRSLKDYKL